MDKILFAFKNGHKLKKAPKSFKERELYRYEAIMRNEYDQRACIAYAEKEEKMHIFVNTC